VRQPSIVSHVPIAAASVDHANVAKEILSRCTETSAQLRATA
jgi:hypothetical protein